ncbi:MAG: RNA pseudouridine synthase [Treponema sp.]|jgi:RluA family pseudouridine synthase|nr:RNA pseudouridine synthase [Treponema sp.]
MKHTVPFTIVYENSEFVAVNKASGIAVGGDRWDDTKERLDLLLSASLQHKVYTVHRIDRDTSGLVVFAHNAEAHKKLSAAFERRSILAAPFADDWVEPIKKRYIAVVYGRFPHGGMTCDMPLVPNGNKRHITIIDKYQGKPSRTHFKLLTTAGNFSVLEVIPETGRTHQIRVHASALGYPIVCDPLYCRNPKPVVLSSFKRGWRGDSFEEKPLLSRLGLHAAEIILPDGTRLSAPLARDMKALITQMEKMRKERGDASRDLEPVCRY